MTWDDDDPDPRRTPDVSMSDDEVEALDVDYSIRGPNDWVISGVLDKSAGAGRFFSTWSAAEAWARLKYGRRFKCRWEAPDGRWAFLIRDRGKDS